MTGDMPIVTRRDMLGELCVVCGNGKYRSVWGLTRFTDSVACNECEAVADRWLTKREILKLRVRDSEDTNG